MARVAASPRPARPLAALGAVGGLLRSLPRNRAALAILAAIVLAASASLAALPGYVNRMSDDGLRRAVADARPYARNISLTQVGPLPRSANGSSTVPINGLNDVVSLGSALQETMPAIVRGAIERQEVVLDAPRWTVRGLPGAPPVLTQRFLQLRLQSNIAGRIRVTEGRLPARRDPVSASQVTGATATGTDRLLVYETAISRATAEQLAVRVGDRLLASADPVYLRDSGLRGPPAVYRVLVEIVGLIEVVAPADDYWLDDSRLSQPGVFETPDVTLVYGTGLLAPEAFARLLGETSPEPWTYEWRYFVDPTRLKESDLAAFESGVRRLSVIYASSNRVRTGLADLARRFADQRLLAVSVLALAAAGLAATALAVLGVLGGLLAERRRAALALARSRGAGVGQLAAAQAIEAAIVALPAALVGGAAAVAWTRPPSPAPALLAAVAVALAAVAALVAATGSPLGGVARQGLGVVGRRQADAGRASNLPRLVLEGLVVVLAAVGVVLLRRRGLAETGRLVDPYLVAVPILLGLAAGIVALRLLPPIARLADRPAARGRGLVPILVARRLARPAGAQLATIAVLLAVALATFAAIVQGSVATALAEAAWRRVGADYRIEQPVPPGRPAPPPIDLAGIAGIAATARAELYPTASIAPAVVRIGDVALVAIDPAAYAAVIAGSPADPDLPVAALAVPGGDRPGSRENPLPAIVSARWATAAVPKRGDTFALDLGGAEVTFVVRDARAAFPGLEPDRPFVIAPLAGLRAIERRPAAPLALVYARAGAEAAGPIAAAARAQAPVAADAPSGTAPVVLARRAEEERARGLPLVAGVTNGFRLGGALIAILALGAVIAAAEQTGRERAYERGYLRLLGLDRRGATRLALLETVPPLALAALGGAALGVAMIRALGPAIDLTAFAAPGQPIALRPAWGAAVALVIAVLAVGTLAGLLASRRGASDDGELLREVNR